MRRNLSWAMLGNASNAAQQALFVVLLAKLAGPAALGVYALAAALVEPPFRLFSLNLRVAQATDLKGHHAFSDYLTLRFFCSLAAAASAWTWASVSGHGAGIGLVLVLAIAVRFLESWVEMIHSLLQKEGSLRQEGISKTVNGLAGLVLCGGVLAWSATVEAMLAMRLAVMLAVMILSDIPAAARTLSGTWRVVLPELRRIPWPRLGRLARVAAPLGWVMFFAALNLSVPRLVLKREGGLEDVGIYGGFAQILAAGQVLVAALGASLMPSLTRAWHHGQRSRYLRLLAVVLAVALAGPWLAVPVIHFAGRPLLDFAFGPAFAGQSASLAVMLVGAGFFYGGSLLAVAMNAMRRFSDQAVILPLICLLHFALCTRWVPTEGVAGAARAFALSSGLLFGLRLVALVRTLPGFPIRPTP